MDAPKLVFRDDCQPGKAYLINVDHMLTFPGEEIDWVAPDTREETYRIALESALRWLTLPAASPQARSQAVRSVLTSALKGN